MAPFDAVLLVAFGGPQGREDIRPFLANVLRGRRVSPERVEEVAAHYERFNGVSPLTAITRRQAEGLRARLLERGVDLPVYLGMRNWDPLLPDVLRAMGRQGVSRAIGFICAPHRCYSSCGQYRENVADACAAAAFGGFPEVTVTYVGDWHTHDKFIEVNAHNIAAALARLPQSVRGSARIVFTAHSLPVAMPGADVYRAQLLESARLVAARRRRADWTVVFQSRSGRPGDRWLEPDVCHYLHEEQTRGLAAAVLCPIGFICDHVEVLHDLDHDAAQLCASIGLPMARARTVNDDPVFLDMMADVVLRTWNRYRTGRPLPLARPRPPDARMTGRDVANDSGAMEVGRV